MFSQTVDPTRQPGAHLPRRADPRRLSAGAAGRLPRLRLARRAARARSSRSCSPLWVWHMPFDSGIRAYFYGSATGVWNVDWITFWGLMLFNTLGRHRRVRELPPLADLAGHARHPRADDAVRLGVRRLARGAGRLRLSLGGGGADPDFARACPTSTRSASPPSPTTRRCPTARSARRSSRWPRSPAIRCWRCPARSAASSRCWRCCRPGC